MSSLSVDRELNSSRKVIRTSHVLVQSSTFQIAVQVQIQVKYQSLHFDFVTLTKGKGILIILLNKWPPQIKPLRRRVELN